jgi:hypothetical protein
MSSRIELKRERINELMCKQLAVKNLIDRNEEDLSNVDRMHFPLIAFEVNPIDVDLIKLIGRLILDWKKRF